MQSSYWEQFKKNPMPSYSLLFAGGNQVHNNVMTDLLEQAVERVRALPPDQQDELARVLLRLAGDEEAVYQLSAEEEADLIEAESEIERSEFASEAEVKAVFAKYRF